MRKVSRNIVLSSVVASSILVLTGCGGGGGSSSQSSSTGSSSSSTLSSYSITAVDDSIINATITADGCSSFEEKSKGEYLLTACTKKPDLITVTGGFVDLDEDGIQDDDEVAMGMPLSLRTNQTSKLVVSPLTTLVANLSEGETIESIASELGISVSQLFEKPEKDSKHQDVLRSINSMLVEAKELGVEDLNEFLKDFRTTIKESEKSTDPLDKLKKVRKKLSDNAKTDKYLNKYGVIFSGFVAERNSDSKTALKNLATEYKVPVSKVVFSGFIFDKFIPNADIQLFTIDSNGNEVEVTEGIEILDGTNDNNDSDNGKWKITVDKTILDKDQVLIFKGSATVNGKDVVLNTAISTVVLRNKFKNRINTSDVKDITITNVTTAKYSLLKKLDSNILTKPNEIIEKKKVIENNPNLKEVLKITSAAIKNVVDKESVLEVSNNVQKDTTEYSDALVDKLLTKIYVNNEDLNTVTIEEDKKESLETTLETEIEAVTDVTKDNLNIAISEIEANRTLRDQLSSTTFEKFTLDKTKLDNKEFKIIFEDGSKYTIELFENGDFRKFNNLVEFFGKWSISSGNLILDRESFSSELSVSGLDVLSKGKIDSSSFTIQSFNSMNSIKIANGLNQVSKFNVFDYDWKNVKRDSRYSYIGNKAILNNGKIIVNAVPNGSVESRAEAKTNFTEKVTGIQAKVRLLSSDSENYATGSFKTYLPDIGGGQGLSIGINVYAGKISTYLWDENTNSTVDSKVLLTGNYLSTDGNNPKVLLNITVSGSSVTVEAIPYNNDTINYSSGAWNVFDLSTHFTVSDSTLSNAQFRAVVKSGGTKNAKFEALDFKAAKVAPTLDSTFTELTKDEIIDLISGSTIKRSMYNTFNENDITYNNDGTRVMGPHTGSWEVKDDGKLYESMNEGDTPFSYKIVKKDDSYFLVGDTNTISYTFKDTRPVNLAAKAINIIETMNIETDNVDDKIDEARTLILHDSSNESVLVKNVLDLTEIINSSEISSIVSIMNTSSINETTNFGQLMKSTVNSAINVDEVYNDISNNSRTAFHNFATRLKDISDNIATVYSSSSYVFKYGSKDITYNDSLALRSSALALAYQLDFISAYSWGSDEDLKTRTKFIDGISYEYSNVDVKMNEVLNNGNFFKLDEAIRLTSAKSYLLEGLELAKLLPLNYEGLTAENKTDINNILDSIKNGTSYELSEESFEPVYDSNGYYLYDERKEEKFFVYLNRLFDPSYAIDITSYGSNFIYTCNPPHFSYNEDVSIKINKAKCTPLSTSTLSQEKLGVKIKAATGHHPSPSSSNFDDVVEKIIKSDNTEITDGQEIINFITQ